MNEELKSIWKKSLRLPQLVGAWLILMIVTTLIFLACMLFLNEPLARSNSRDVATLLIFGAASASALLAMWIFLRWLFRWRNFKRFLFGFACFVTLIALFYAEENWRGKHDWEKFKREGAAKGEKFDFKDFVPPPVPDDQNFAMTPVVAGCYNYILTRDGKKIPSEQRDTNLVDRLSFDLGDQKMKTNGLGYWAKGTTSDLKIWQHWYRDLATTTNLFAVPPQPKLPAADVLLALSKYDATIEELRQASLLPESRFPLNYDTENKGAILLPELAAMKRSVLLLRLRALAELQNGQNEKALADVKLALRLVEAIHTEPFLISHLVRIAMVEIILQPIYEGLANHQWTDGELIVLDAELAKLDFLKDYRLSMWGERAGACAVIDYIAKKNRYQRYSELTEMESSNDANDASEPIRAIGITLMPAGWFDQNKLMIARGLQGWITGVVSPKDQLASPQKYREVGQTQSAIFNRPSRPWNFLAKHFLPALGAAGRKACREQISVDLARTAIALERYRLAHGEYPESLDALAPQFIAQVPHDVIGGGPLKYRRTSDGQFVLYSIGWNETDDGGVTEYRKNGSTPDFESGDWVWRYPGK